MPGAKAWAAYTAAIVGAPVEDFEQKFSSLAESERNAWAAVQNLAVPAEVPKSLEPVQIARPAALKL